jgi:hypothetical protein
LGVGSVSNYRFEVLHPYTIIQLWDELLPHIERVIKVSNDEFTAESIKSRATSGNSLMITVFENDEIIAVTTAEVVTYDSGLKSLLIPIFAGDGMLDWGKQILELYTDMAKQLGCTELRGLAVRGGWMRILKDYGWKESYTVISMPLGEKL